MYKLYRTVISAIGWVITAFLTIFFGTTSVIGSLVSKSGRIQHWSIKWWSRSICFMSATKVKLHGLEHVDHKNPQVFASNHQSVYDILVLGGWMPVQFAWVARKEWFDYPFLGWHLSRSGAVNIDRSNPRAAARSLMKAAKDIKAGKNIMIFPEGTRHPDAMLQDFKEGAFLLAQKADVPIVPITLVGTKDVIRKNTWVAYKADVDVYIHPPIDPAEYGKTGRQQLSWAVEDAIASRLPEDCRTGYEERRAERPRDGD